MEEGFYNRYPIINEKSSIEIMFSFLDSSSPGDLLSSLCHAAITISSRFPNQANSLYPLLVLFLSFFKTQVPAHPSAEGSISTAKWVSELIISTSVPPSPYHPTHHTFVFLFNLCPHQSIILKMLKTQFSFVHEHVKV